MTRSPALNLLIRRECLTAEARDLRQARDTQGAARAEAELRKLNTEILRAGLRR